MIQATGFPTNAAHAERFAYQYNSATATINDQRTASVDHVSISAAAQVAAGKPVNLDDLPSLTFDYHEFMRQAQAGLHETMRQLGIPLGAWVSIKTNNDGTLTVESDSSRNAELAAAVNNNHELRNALVGAENMAYINRIGHASWEAQKAGAANPGKANYYNNWAVNIAGQITGMGFEFDFSNSQLTGSFLSGGQKIGLTEHTEMPLA